jgi:hypothetical protein
MPTLVNDRLLRPIGTRRQNRRFCKRADRTIKNWKKMTTARLVYGKIISTIRVIPLDGRDKGERV